MDFQSTIHQMVEFQRKNTFASSPQITLGELIKRLTPMVEKNKERVAEGKEEANVMLDFEYLFPGVLESWRGSYAELAITFSQYGGNEKPPTLTKFYSMLKEAIGKTYCGYKGGDFTMSESTPVWVANHGHSGNTGVVGVKNNDYEVLILTAYCEF